MALVYAMDWSDSFSSARALLEWATAALAKDLGVVEGLGVVYDGLECWGGWLDSENGMVAPRILGGIGSPWWILSVNKASRKLSID